VTGAVADMSGQTVAIVGGSSGIGLAIAEGAAARGARVLLLSRSEDKLRAAAEKIGERATYAVLDMLDAEQAAQTLGSLERIDHLAMTAVANENRNRGRVTELTTEQVERSLDKLRGFANVSRAAIPRMAERGSITLTSGASAIKPPREGMAILAAVNASVTAFAHALALECSPIRVNAVTPGVVDTDVWDAEARKRIGEWARSPDLPAQHFGQPADIAEAFVFLMCNPYMTGHDLVVDGGLVAT
jgi:NAD(P)-dependent dehydrogenase (short-subunit alcohol dehydrogenase family)